MPRIRKSSVLRAWLVGAAAAGSAVALTLLAGFSMNSNPRGTRAMGHPAIAENTATPQSEEAQGGTLGGSVISREGAAEVDIASLPQLTAQQAAVMPRYSHRPLDGLSDAQYSALKAEAAKRGAARQGATQTAAPSSSSTGRLQPINITSGFFGQQEVCCSPPDMALAVGPTFVVQFVNTFIAVYNKK